MMIPFCCPVCHGHGTVSQPPWVAGDIPRWTSHDTSLYPCPACYGTGLVWSAREGVMEEVDPWKECDRLKARCAEVEARLREIELLDRKLADVSFQLAQTTAREARLRGSACHFLEKMDALMPVVSEAFAFQQIHGFPWETWKEELATFRAALAEGKET